MKLVHRVVLAVIAGGLLGLTALPVGIKMVGWIALVPLLISIDKTKWWEAFLLGMLTGIFYFSIGFYWLAVYSKQAFIISLLITSGFIGLFCLFVQLLQPRLHMWYKFLFPPLVWASLAYVFSFTPFDSYWTHFAEPQLIYLLQIIAITGMAGLTFMMVMSNSIVASYILSKKKNERKVIVIAGAILIAIIFISLLYGAINLKNDVSGDVSVAVVQPNFPNDVEWRKKHVEEIFKVYEELILKAKEADIIVLPQYTWPVSVSTTSRILKNLSRITDSYITIGTYRGYVNIAILFSKEGELVGEYVAVNKPPFRNQTPGHEYVVLDSGMGNLGMLLCYDTTDEKIAREFVRNDAQVLVSMANDNVFLGTTEPEQHLEQDILRAVENRRYIVRAAPSGISAIIDPYGRIVNRSEIGKRQVLFGSVKLMNEKTIFTQIGHIFSPLALVALLVMYVMRRK